MNPLQQSIINAIFLGFVKNNDFLELQQAISNGADVNQPSPSGETPLHHAAHHGLVEVTRILIGACAKLESKDKNGLTPLMLAIQARHVDVVRLLVESGAVVNDGCNQLAVQEKEHLTASLAQACEIEGIMKAAQTRA